MRGQVGRLVEDDRLENEDVGAGLPLVGPQPRFQAGLT